MPTLPTPPWAIEEPPLPAPDEILVTGFDVPPGPGSAPVGDEPPAPAARSATADPPTMGDGPRDGGAAHPEWPAGGSNGAARSADLPDPPTDDAFPSLAALDAIRAAFAEDPPGPDEATRAEFAALLGLDPALAAEEAAFLEVLRDAPPPEGYALLAEWLSAALAAEPGVGPAPAADWPFP